MALAKRIIPCLDVQDGRTVKGIHFEDMHDVGDPVLLGAFYAAQGADELVFLDISATLEKRKTFSALVRRVAEHVNIPFTVGGGITSIDDVSVLLNSGADKVSINSAAVKNPKLINELAHEFGSQCVVIALDVKFEDGDLYLHLNGGKLRTTHKALDWAKEAVDRGAGEILLTSMDHDGTKEGFALELTKLISQNVSVPVIASGGAGNMKDFADVFEYGHADGALAASIFHYKEIEISALKKYLISQGFPIRKTFIK